MKDAFRALGVLKASFMALSAGSWRDDKGVRRVERDLSAFTILGLSHMSDFRAAAGLYRAARKNGCTIRSTIECLIAAVCIREDLRLLHADRDFDRLAELTTLSVVDC